MEICQVKGWGYVHTIPGIRIKIQACREPRVFAFGQIERYAGPETGAKAVIAVLINIQLEAGWIDQVVETPETRLYDYLSSSLFKILLVKCLLDDVAVKIIR